MSLPPRTYAGPTSIYISVLFKHDCYSISTQLANTLLFQPARDHLKNVKVSTVFPFVAHQKGIRKVQNGGKTGTPGLKYYRKHLTLDLGKISVIYTNDSGLSFLVSLSTNSPSLPHFTTLTAQLHRTYETYFNAEINLIRPTFPLRYLLLIFR